VEEVSGAGGHEGRPGAGLVHARDCFKPCGILSRAHS
jgi:hypothetical protein